MNKIYENKMGAKIEVIEDNYKDSFGRAYVTWKFIDTNRSYCVLKESFMEMLKANFYKVVK